MASRRPLEEEKGDDEAETLRLEVIALAQELTMEVLNKSPTDVTTIYTCCAEYLGRKMRRRASRKAVSTKAAWSEEREVMKRRQVAFHERDANTLTPRPLSAPAARSLVTASAVNHGDSDGNDDDADIDTPRSVTPRDSAIDTHPGLLTRDSPPEAPSDCDEVDHDSGFNTSEGVSENTLKSGSSTPATSCHSLTECFPPEHPSSRPSSRISSRPSSSISSSSCSSSSRVRRTPAGQSLECQELEEDDPCTFAYFKSTSERAPDSDATVPARSAATCSSRPVQRRVSSGRVLVGHRPHQEQHLRTLLGHEAAVIHCLLTETLVVTSSRDATLRVWCQSTGRLKRIVNCRRPVHTFLRVSSPADHQVARQYLLAGCEDGVIILFRLEEEQEAGEDAGPGGVRLALVGEYTGHLPNPVRSMAASRDARRLATGCCFFMTQITLRGTAILTCRGTLKTWDLAAMLEAAEGGKANDSGSPVAVRTMRQMVTSQACMRRKASYHKVSDDPEDHLEAISHGIRALAYSPDGALIVVGFGYPDDTGARHERLLAILCATTLNTLWLDQSRICQVMALQFLPTPGPNSRPAVQGDSFKLLLSTFDSLLLLVIQEVDEQDLRVKCSWKHTFNNPHFGSVASDDGRFIVSSLGMSIRFRSSSSGAEAGRLEDAHDGWVYGVGLSPDGETLCSASADGSVSLWRVPRMSGTPTPSSPASPAGKTVNQKPRKRQSSASGSSQQHRVSFSSSSSSLTASSKS